MPLYLAQRGDLVRCYQCLTDLLTAVHWLTTLKDRATQLLIKCKTGALVTQKAVLGHYAVTIKIWDCELCDQSDQPERGFDELWSSSFGVPTKIGGGESGILTFHFGEIIFQLRLSSPSIWSSTPPPFLITKHFSLFSQRRAGQRREESANAIVYFSTCWGIHYRSFPSL